MENIAVAYMSKTGSTAEVARKIRERITKQGCASTVINLKEDPDHDFSDFTGIILGAPINGMQVLSEFQEYVRTNKEKFPKVLGFFVLSFMHNQGRKMWTRAIEKSVSDLNASLNASRTRIFNGRIDKEMPLFARIIFGLPKGLPVDNINWKAVEAWSDTLGESVS